MSGSNKRIQIAYDAGVGIITITLPPSRCTFPAIWRFAIKRNVIDVEVIRDEALTGFVLTLTASRLHQCHEQLSRLLPPAVVNSIIGGPRNNRTIYVSGQVLTQAIGALRQIAKFSHACLRTPAPQPATVPLLPGANTQDVIRRRRAEKILSGLVDSSTGRIPARRIPQPLPRPTATS